MDNLPVVYINESSLRRQKEKLERSNFFKDDTERCKKQKKPPKVEFYRAGVTRLSRSSTKRSEDDDNSEKKTTLKTTSSLLEMENLNLRGDKESGKSMFRSDAADDKIQHITQAGVVQENSSNRRRQNRRRHNSETHSVKKLYDPDSDDRQYVPRSTIIHQPVSNAFDNGEKSVHREKWLQQDLQQQDLQKHEKERKHLYDANAKILTSVPSSKKIVQSVETLLPETERCKAMINLQLEKIDFTLPSHTKDQFFTIRDQLKQMYRLIILQDIEFATKHNIDHSLWKNVFHQVVENFRGRIESSEDKDTLVTSLSSLLTRAYSFYEELLRDLNQQFHLKLPHLQSFPENLSRRSKKSNKQTKMALMISHRMLLCLGDISRYQASVNETNNFGEARRWYMHAKAVEPRNGRPYNQLALLAVLTKRKLEAVYYYTRSLATLSNPILTARESLMALFNDARRKLEFVHQRQLQKLQTISALKQSPVPSHPQQTESQHKEEWILPDFTSSEKEIEKDDYADKEAEGAATADPGDMGHAETLKQFVLIFLNIHGILFTRIGFDSFDGLKIRSLKLLQLLLESNPLAVNFKVLIHVFVINFFSISDQLQKLSSSAAAADGGGAELLLGHALHYTFATLAAVCDETARGLRSLRDDPTCDQLLRKCDTLLQVVKLCCDWLYLNKTLWYSPASSVACKYHVSDLMQSLAKLCDWVSCCVDEDTLGVPVFKENAPQRRQMVLPEDEEVVGFAPLTLNDVEPAFVLERDLSARRRDNAVLSVRLHYVHDFLQYVCGMEAPLLAYKGGRYVVLMEQRPASDSPLVSTLASQFELFDRDESFLADDGYAFMDEYDVIMHPDDELNELKTYHRSLQITKESHEKRRDHINRSLAAAQKTHDSSASLRVEPRHLIPDTNCFIDHLELLESVLRHGHFTIGVPLIVLAELEGLAASRKEESQHGMFVHARAARAVLFLRRVLSSDHRATSSSGKLKALTNRGSELETLSFVCQQLGDPSTNDDLILQCCVNYETRAAKKCGGRDRHHQRTRTTVLLTDDRNLRVKALTRGMPTRALPDFCKWAQLPPDSQP